jgi:hypothetical protein
MGTFESLVYILISELKLKYTEKYLRYYLYKITDDEKSREHIFGDFFYLLLVGKHKFVCYLKFNVSYPTNIQKVLGGDTLEEVVSSLSSFLSDKEEIRPFFDSLPREYKEDGKNFLEEGGYFMKISLDGYDYNIIGHSARDKLIQRLDILLYQNNFLSFSIVDEILINDETLKNVFLVDTKRERNFNIYRSRKNISADFIDIMKNSNNEIDYDTLARINDSLKYYRFYLNENNTDSALLNLWIALESLFPSYKKSDNFDLIKSIIPTVVSFYYLRETFDDLQLFVQERIKQENSKGIKYGTYFNLKKYVEKNNSYKKRTKYGIEAVAQFNAVGIMKVLSDKEKKEYFMEGIDNPCLNFRCDALSDIITVTEGKFIKLKDFLSLKYSTIQWEIYDIYRIRNSIVHGGRESSLAIEALYFLEYYYVLLLDDILEKLGSSDFKRVLNMEEYLDRVRRSYVDYNNLISEKLNEKEYKLIVLPYFVL